MGRCDENGAYSASVEVGTYNVYIFYVLVRISEPVVVGRMKITNEGGAMSSESESQDKTTGLSSAKREDIWALIIAGIVMLISIAAPEAVHNFFKNVLYIF